MHLRMCVFDCTCVYACLSVCMYMYVLTCVYICKYVNV